MVPLQIELHPASHVSDKSTVVTGARSMDPLDGVELALMEARGRVLGALDRELEAVRALKARRSRTSSSHEVFQQSPLPSNVLPMDRKDYSPEEQPPLEAALDPALERATIEELNAALAAAFNQISAQ